MPQLVIYQDILNGFVEYTGNTQGVTSAVSVPLSDLGYLLVATQTPPGLTTIADWLNGASGAYLTGYTGSVVRKAYLVWMSQIVPDNNGSSAAANNSVTLISPQGTNHSIPPNGTWSQSTLSGGQTFISRIADVTSIVTNAGTGFYIVKGIPSGRLNTLNDVNYVAWNLVVIWYNASLPPRFINFVTYNDLHGVVTTYLNISGFITPATGPVTGRVALAATSAESNTISGNVKFGSSIPSLVTLTGPNNVATNFFQSQINNANPQSPNVGLLDTTGTFGTRNAIPNAAPVIYDRYHFDQTNVSINAGLTNNQTTGVFSLGPANNGYLINLVSLQLDAQAPAFNAQKSVSKAFASTGDTLTYTAVILNSGNSSTNNMVFVDTVPTGTSFVANTFAVNGVTIPGVNPASPGYNLGAFAVNQIATVTFQVSVTAPNGTLLSNSFYGGYDYTPAPGLNFNGNITSNTASTFIGTQSVSSSKSVDKATVNLGDVLNYTVAIKNTGNATIDNLSFYDTIPNGTVFNTGSININGTNFPTLTTSFNFVSPQVPLGPNSTNTVTFRVTVVTIPSPNEIYNTASSIYGTILNETTVNGVITSNGVTSTAEEKSPAFNTQKSVSKVFANPGDTITYTAVILNSGNFSSNNLVFVDTIPTGTSFVANTFAVNGVTVPGANPASPGYNIGSFAVNQTVTVTFQVAVTAPNGTLLSNSFFGGYDYTPAPGVNFSGNVTSNTVSTFIGTQSVSSGKSVDKATVNLGDVLNYTVAIKNTGNATIDNLSFYDTLPNGTVFNTGTLYINGTNFPTLTTSFNFVSPQVPLGSNSTNTVTFSVTVVTIPSPNEIYNTASSSYGTILNETTVNGVITSNGVTSTVNTSPVGVVGVTKTVDKLYADINNVITYTVNFKNTSINTITAMTFNDTVPNGTVFNTGSIYVDGVNFPTLTTTFNFTSPQIPLAPNKSTTVSFKVTVTTIPSPNPIQNQAATNLAYTYFNSNSTVPATAMSNVVDTQINHANLSNMSKSVDKAYATCGEKLNYTINLFNSGNVTADSIILRDTIPNGTAFVSNSVYVNGILQAGADPATGITIPNISPNSSATVTFRVEVVC